MPDTQFVMLTVYEDAEHIFNALAAGASGYLLKRTKRAALLAALADVQAGGSPMTSNIARKVVQAFQWSGSKDSETADLTVREREVLELQTGNKGLEQRAREQLGLVGEGETYYQLVEDPPPDRGLSPGHQRRHALGR